MKKLSVLTAATVATLLASPAFAEEKGPSISANVALTTDYRWRGVTQSNEAPATQGGLDYSMPLGASGASLYLGAWGSSINFGDNSQASVEMDFYGGITTEISGIGVDVGVIRYAYPGADESKNYDFTEYKLGLSYSPVEALSLGLNYNYSPEFTGNTGNASYLQATAEYAPKLDTPLPLTFSASYGRSNIDQSADYSDWSVGVSTSYKQLTFAATYIDTSKDNDDAADSTGVFTVSASF